MAGQRVKGGGGEVGSEREPEGNTCQRVVKAIVSPQLDIYAPDRTGQTILVDVTHANATPHDCILAKV